MFNLFLFYNILIILYISIFYYFIIKIKSIIYSLITLIIPQANYLTKSINMKRRVNNYSLYYIFDRIFWYQPKSLVLRGIYKTSDNIKNNNNNVFSPCPY